MDRIELMKAFVAVATEGNFSKAAVKLNISNQLVSKYVSLFEQHLSLRLFNRTTRKVSLTEAGHECLLHTQQILENIKDMEGHLGQLHNRAQGLLRINAPVSFAALHLSPLIPKFQKQHPEVGINLQLNDREVDVIDEGFDIALRIGNLRDSSLVAKHITPIRLALCASPDYLQHNGIPKTPKELIPQHHLRYSYMDYEQSSSLLLKTLKDHNRDQYTGLICNNGEVLVSAAIAGQGYTLQPTFLVGEAVKQGTLKVILAAFEPPALGLYAVYPHRKLLPTKVQAFVDFLSNAYGSPPYWDTADGK